jgi:hypothetical protein
MTDKLNAMGAFQSGASIANAVSGRRLQQQQIGVLQQEQAIKQEQEQYKRQQEQYKRQQEQAKQQLGVLAYNDPNIMKEYMVKDPQGAKQLFELRNRHNKISSDVIDYVADKNVPIEERNIRWQQALPILQQNGLEIDDLPQELDNDGLRQLELTKKSIKTWDDAFKTVETAQGLKTFDPVTGRFGDTPYSAKPLANASASGGATGAVVRDIMKDNPGMRFTDALQLYQTGFRSGTKIDPETGEVVAQPGFVSTVKQIESAKSAGKKTGELQTEKEFTAPIAFSSLESGLAKSDNVLKTIDDVLPRVNALTSGFGGKQLSKISGTDALDVQRDIDTIIANLGFEELQEMRNNSKTGGALGNVVVKELELLQSVKSNIQTDQSPSQLRKNLEKARKLKIESDDRIRKAFEREYGKDTYKQFKKESSKPLKTKSLEDIFKNDKSR